MKASLRSLLSAVKPVKTRFAAPWGAGRFLRVSIALLAERGI